MSSKTSRSSGSPYTVKHWTDKGLTEEEARCEIQKRRPSNMLYWTNKGYSEPEAKQKVREHQGLRNKSRLKTKETDPDQYYKSHPTRIEYWLAKGYSVEDAKLKLSDHQATFNLEKCVKRYGELEGQRIWQDRQDRWQKTLNNKSDEERAAINKKKDCMSVGLFIEKYGPELGPSKFKEECKKRSCSLESYIKKFGEREGRERYKQFREKIRRSKRFTNSSIFSKESLEVFIPLYEWLLSRNYNQTDIFIGCNELGEYHLFGNMTSISSGDMLTKNYFYDFTVKSLNIMIEYNGERHHPNPSMSEEKWEKWRSAFGKRTADECHKYQMNKIGVARKAGFDVLEIWSSSSFTKNIEICKEFIAKHEHKL